MGRRRCSRSPIAFHVGVIAVLHRHGRLWLAIVVTGYLFVGNWLAYLCGKPMHAGLRDNVPDFRLCVRSNTLHPRMTAHTKAYLITTLTTIPSQRD